VPSAENRHFNRLKSALVAGEPTFGVIVTIPSVHVIQTLASAGVDWVIIDLEHSSIDLGAAHAMIAATSGTQVVPLVRVPWTDPWQAKTLMDIGAMGVAFPMICDAERAKAAVRSVRYPPEGERLWGPFYAPMRTGQSMAEYIESANDNMLAIVTIEHPDAVGSIDRIMSVPGIDLAFIGPGDLAMAMGIPGQFNHPMFMETVRQAEAGILRSQVALGGVARTPEQAREMVERGYRAIVFGFDWMLLQQSASRFIQAVRD
jgi:4-hydroxy-2-oxoheptanedioate aldolase